MEDFRASAARLAGAMTVLFGWRPGDFWEATPAEIATVFEAMAGEGDAAACALDLARMMEEFPDG